MVVDIRTQAFIEYFGVVLDCWDAKISYGECRQRRTMGLWLFGGDVQIEIFEFFFLFCIYHENIEDIDGYQQQ